ncbi:MAG: hypothetical protein IT574_02075 [Candidatus Aureabacteria bacterium]|nr:hypothetical protein [Candidatus Auribacterota bacterium]NLW94013.1 hypothetical protein [Chlamydiota bacterium]HOE27426.1 hypothetical protein [bacterium]HQM52750.1 hypothetical protein [bacterium]
MDEYVRCPHCGGDTPDENLNCIYCGEAFPAALGVFGALRYGWRGVFCAAVALVLILSILAWLVV